MADKDARDGISTLFRDSATPTNSDLDSTTNEPVRQKRTRSQLNVPDLVLRLPLLHSPLKAARKARAKARGTSATRQVDSQLHTTEGSTSSAMAHGEAVAPPNLEIEAATREGTHGVGEDMDTCADGRIQGYEEEDKSEDSLFFLAGHRGKGFDEDAKLDGSQHPVWPTNTKKRPSPDADAMRTLSSPGTQPQSKRVKVEAFRTLGRGRDRSGYHEPLRDPDACTPGRFNGYKRASSAKPTSSESKVPSSIFLPRAQSVPLDGESEVRTIDLTSIPPSPRRSPSKCEVEITCAPSVPPPDSDRMDVDINDTSTLLHFTNPTQPTSVRANPVFRYTVNFATPRRPETPTRSGLPSTSPLSPLSPLTPSPFPERMSGTQSLLAKANTKLLAHGTGVHTDTPTGPKVPRPVADMTASMDMFQHAVHVSSQLSSAAITSYPASAVPYSSAAPQARLTRLLPTSNNPTELIPTATDGSKNDSADAVTALGSSSRAENPSPSNVDVAKKVSAGALVNVPSGSNSRSDSSVVPAPRPRITTSMKPKREPSVPQGPKRITRSVSMKEQRVKGERIETEDVTAGDCAAEMSVATKSVVAGPSSEVGDMAPPLTTVTSKLHPPKLIGAVSSKSRPPSSARRSASVSKIPPNPNQLKQMSLNMFVKVKSSAALTATAGSSMTSNTPTNTTSSSRPVPSSSPSKLPLPVSPLKRPLKLQSGKTRSFQFPLGLTDTTVGMGTSREPSGRSLTTLSHALDKLIVPPPNRPNTSMGFVTTDGMSDEDVPDKGKGKRKAKDDTSLPQASTTQAARMTFARPTASSLKRAATMSGFRPTGTTGPRGRGGTVIGALGRGRGTMGIFGRAGNRASKKTSLPVVAGSPAKGPGGTDDLDLDREKHAGGAAGEGDVFASQSMVMQDTLVGSSTGNAGSPKLSLPAAATAINDMEIDLTVSPISADKGKQRAVSLSTLNPASSALHALSESLSSLPQTPTPPKPKVVGTRTGLRSSTAATGKESSVLDGSGVGPSGNEIHDSGAGPDNATANGSGGVKKSSLKILKRCAIFVDVRTEQGDDAGSLFVDMLKGLGAKIMGRLGQTCTHIVYKNGLPNTLTRYRMLNDPKPIVVGIAWVVECAEKRARVDEEKFKIDVDVINVAGGNHKRRRSMFPKHLIPVSPGPDHEMFMNMSSEADGDEEGAIGVDGSPSQDPDVSIRSREEDDLPPLERARRRRSILPGGQTRLVP